MSSFGSASGSASAITPLWAFILVALISMFATTKRDAPVAPESKKKYQEP